MIRKAISLETYQDEALKLISQETGKSESEIIRTALDEKYPKLIQRLRKEHTEVRG